MVHLSVTHSSRKRFDKRHILEAGRGRVLGLEGLRFCLRRSQLLQRKGSGSDKAPVHDTPGQPRPRPAGRL